jgi:hypothetical protein
MGIDKNIESEFSTYSIISLPAWDERLAHWVSRLSNPPFLAITGITISAYTVATKSAWLWAAAYYIVLSVFITYGLCALAGALRQDYRLSSQSSRAEDAASAGNSDYHRYSVAHTAYLQRPASADSYRRRRMGADGYNARLNASLENQRALRRRSRVCNACLHIVRQSGYSSTYLRADYRLVACKAGKA